MVLLWDPPGGGSDLIIPGGGDFVRVDATFDDPTADLYEELELITFLTKFEQ